MLFSDLRYDYVRTWFTRLDDAPFDQIAAVYSELEDQGRTAIAATTVNASEITVARAADMRYVGQEHAVTVDLPMAVFDDGDRESIKTKFDEMHELRYGTSAPAERAEIVSLRSTITGMMAKPPLERVSDGGAQPEAVACTGTRSAYFTEIGEFAHTPTYNRDALKSGNSIVGPALIEEHASTTVLLPNDSMTVDIFGILIIEVATRRR